MSRLFLSFSFFVLACSDAEATRRSAPVPVGVVAAGVDDVLEPVGMLSACLPPTSPLDVPAAAKVVVEVLDQADGDDQQAFAVTIISHAHEDTVACVRDTVAAWAGEP